MNYCQTGIINLESFNSTLGVRSKYHELLDICDKLNDPEVIVLCETWLKPSDPHPNILGYSFSGCDRKNGKGGGIGILVKNKSKVKTIPRI